MYPPLRQHDDHCGGLQPQQPGVRSEEIQEAGEGHGGYNPYDTDWENIKFFYGQNNFAELLSDMDKQK